MNIFHVPIHDVISAKCTSQKSIIGDRQKYAWMLNGLAPSQRLAGKKKNQTIGEEMFNSLGMLIHKHKQW